MAFATYFFCIALLCGARGNPLGSLGPLSQTVCETIPNMYPLHGSIYDHSSLPFPVPSTTICESSPNLLGLGLGYPCPHSYPGYLPYPYSYPRLPLSYPYDNLGYYPYSNYPVPTTTVCESSPNVPFPIPILPFPNVPVPNVGATTVCETTPNVLPVNGLPLPYPGLIPGYGPIGMPFL